MPMDKQAEIEMLNTLESDFRDTFELPEAAVNWLMMMYRSIQVLDDFADGDEVERSTLDRAIYELLIGIPKNTFFRQFDTELLPLVTTMVLKWQASDSAERQGKANEKSFVWRAGYYDLILVVLQICHGMEYAAINSAIVMEMYGEQYSDYMKEFNHA